VATNGLSELAREYADQLEAWGADRRAKA
jgi:hypothetical protein